MASLETSTHVHAEHRPAARRRGADRAAVRDDQRPARDDLARRPLHAAEPRLGAAARLDASRSCRRSPMQELMHPDDVEQTLALMLAGDDQPGPARELHQPLPPPRRLLALAAVERALRRRHLVRGRQGRHRPHVAGAPGAARPADAAAQPPAADGPRAPGARAPAPQQRRRSRCCSSTSTGSRRSTTTSATTSATSC